MYTPCNRYMYPIIDNTSLFPDPKPTTKNTLELIVTPSASPASRPHHANTLDYHSIQETKPLGVVSPTEYVPESETEIEKKALIHTEYSSSLLALTPLTAIASTRQNFQAKQHGFNPCGRQTPNGKVNLTKTASNKCT